MRELKPEHLNTAIAIIILITNNTAAADLLDLKEDRCYTKTDLSEADINNRCWIIVDGNIYDVSNSPLWRERKRFTYKCGDFIETGRLAAENITTAELLDYYGNPSQNSRIGLLCETRTHSKPENCGDKKCQVDKENFINCPQDCPSNASDGLCVPFDDFTCDPDCGRRHDPNCVCKKDRICETEYENHTNCPTDCPPENPDGLCYKRQDGYCDPDCSSEEDMDCKIEAKTSKTKPVETRGCGDGVCDDREDYLNCRIDCRSGGKDRYCDGVSDRICDPDCLPEDDPDCQTTKQKNNHQKDDRNNIYEYMPYIAATILITLTIVYITYRKIKHNE